MLYNDTLVNRNPRRSKPNRCIGNGKNQHPTSRLQFIWEHPKDRKPKVIKHYR